MTAPSVVVVGAGPTGLACAHRLLQLGHAPEDVVVLDAADRAGGAVRTTREDGFLLEHGPDAFRGDAPALLATLRELALEADVVRAPADLDRHVLRRGRLVRLPRSPRDLLTTSALAPGARARLLAEPLVRPGAGEESVSAFVRRRLGRGCEALADAFVTGVAAGDPARLSVDEAFPALRRMERDHGSLFRALRARGAAPAGLASLAGGLQDLVDALAARTRPVLRAPAQRIARDGEGWTVTTPKGAFSAPRVVVALPPAKAAKVVPDAAWPLPREAPVAVLGLGFEAADVGAPPGYGYLAPESERHFALGAVFASNAFPGRAPAGRALLRVLVGGVRHPERAWMPAEDLAPAALAALHEAGVVRGEPAWTRLVRAPQGIPQPELGHAHLRAAVRASELANPGITVCGWGYRGVSLESAVAEGRSAADAAGAPAAPKA